MTIAGAEAPEDLESVRYAFRLGTGNLQQKGDLCDDIFSLTRHSGRGEVRIHGTDGKIRNSNTIGKPDPNPPHDTKH